MGEQVLAGLPKDFGASVTDTPTVGAVTLVGDLDTLGVDAADVASQRATIESQIASDMGVDSSQLAPWSWRAQQRESRSAPRS